MLSRITYVSKRRLSIENLDWNLELSEILTRARVHNTWLDISGALFVTDTHFVQVIEGEVENLEKLFAEIACDSRHEVFRIEKASPEGRSFRKWSMAYFDMRKLDFTLLTPVTDFWQGSPASPLVAMMRYLLENLGEAEHA